MTSKQLLNHLCYEYGTKNYNEGKLKAVQELKKDIAILRNNKDLLIHLIEKELLETYNSYCGCTNEEREKIKNYRKSLIEIKEWLENEEK